MAHEGVALAGAAHARELLLRLLHVAVQPVMPQLPLVGGIARRLHLRADGQLDAQARLPAPHCCRTPS